MEAGRERDGAVSCPHGERCGGCTLLETSADAQAAHKRGLVERALAPYPALCELPVSEVVRATPALGYRTRAKLVARGQELGLYARGGHEVVDIPGCRVLSPALLVVAAGLRQQLGATAAGWQLSGVDLREALTDDGVRVLVTLIGPEHAQEALRALALSVLELPAVASVAVANRREDAPTFFGATPFVAAGPATLRDRLAPALPWVLATHGSFTQAHRGQAARLLHRTLQALEGALSGLRGKRVLELYAGQGSLGLALGAAGASALLVERFEPSLALASEAAVAQSIAGVSTRADDAALAVEDLCDAGERFDAVIVNPPRHGLPKDVREGLARLAPRCVVYVSCDPATLARDLSHLSQLGLRARRVEPFDMMPLSASIECFALLEPAPAPPLRVVYEDEQLLVVDKPPHLPTTPQSGRADSVLSRAMRERGLPVLHAVHRLDQETSGLCLLAKRREAVAALSSALREGEKRYLALARGVCRPKGIVRRPLLQDGQPREAVTRYTRLQVLGGHSLVRARPEHGRTHQVRRHLASLGHPVLGDSRHGDAPSNRHFALAHGLDRTFLHLERLALVNPSTSAPLVLEAALAPDLAVVLEALRATNATPRAR